MSRSERAKRAVTIAGIILLALAVSVAAIFLSRWQWHRHEVRSDEVAAYEAGQSLAPAPLDDIVPGTEFPSEARWRVATVAGAFDSDSLTWLRNRPVSGSPASHALAWFVTDDGQALLVDAGWVAAESTARPSLPAEHLTLTVTLRPFEPDDGKRGEGATRITPAQMPTAPADEVPGYGVLAQACQDPCGPLPGLAITPLPQPTAGPHLSYAIQWLLLAVAAPVIAVVWIRRELMGEVAVPKAPRRRAELSDEEIEDAL